MKNKDLNKRGGNGVLSIKVHPLKIKYANCVLIIHQECYLSEGIAIRMATFNLKLPLHPLVVDQERINEIKRKVKKRNEKKRK